MNPKSILYKCACPQMARDDVEICTDPFPHVIIQYPYLRSWHVALKEAFPPWEQLAGGDPEPNKAHRCNASQVIGSPAGRFTQEFFTYHTSAEWVSDVASVLPDLQWLTSLQTGVRHTGDHELSLDCQFVINTPSVGGTTVRDPHVDNPCEAFAALWYFRDNADAGTEGGELVLYDCDEVQYHRSKYGKGSVDPKYLTPAKTIQPKSNMFILFQNGPTAVHGVTPRAASEHPRMYINIIGEVQKPLFSLE